jgi:hypothetical protein
MTEYAAELELGTITLSNPERLWNPLELAQHVQRLVKEISRLGEAQSWRKLTCLEAGLQASARGQICRLFLVPSAQAHLEVKFQSRDARSAAAAMLKERSKWLSMLQASQLHMVGLRLSNAFTATAPFRQDGEAAYDQLTRVPAHLIGELERLRGRTANLQLHVKGSILQLGLEGFGGMRWSELVEVSGLPFRTHYGVRIELTRQLLLRGFEARHLQVHYDDLSLVTQAKADEATRLRSQLRLRGRVGRRDLRRGTSLVFQPEPDR